MALQHLSPTLDNAYDVFVLDQKAQGHTPRTQDFYRWTLRPFIDWLTGADVARLAEVTPTHIRTYLVSLRERSLSGFTVHGAARSIRAFFQFLYSRRVHRGVADG